MRSSQRSVVVPRLSPQHPLAAMPFLRQAGTNALCQDCSPGYANPLHTATQYQGGRHSPRGLMGHTQGLLGARVASTKRAGVTSLRGWSISCAQGLREPGNPVAFQRRQGSDLFVLSMGRYWEICFPLQTVSVNRSVCAWETAHLVV